MSDQTKSKTTAYDRYIDYRRFSIAVFLFVLILILPIPTSMLDVAVEYTVGEESVQSFCAQELFGQSVAEIEQWQALTAETFEACMMQGVSSKQALLKRSVKDLRNMGIKGRIENFAQSRTFMEGLDAERVNDLLLRGRELRHNTLAYEDLPPDQQAEVSRAARNMRIVIAMVAFV
ncbi:MAG: hypothetical protein ABIG68_04020, partial [Acidobacteriota bacterium]